MMGGITAGAPGPDPDRIAELFAEALELPPDQRRAFLDERCTDAPALRAELESLIAAHEERVRVVDVSLPVDRARGAALIGAAPDTETGRKVGPYRLLREIGRGGMGVVYLAERAEGGFDQRVAIKLVKRGMDSDAILQRFLRERQILAGLDHPHVARLLDGGVTHDGQPYFALELVDGRPLTASCNERQLGLTDRLRLFEEACRAVQHAHSQLVIHRDLKPSNMLVTGEGQLKLLDFGVAKLLGVGDESGGTLTQTGLHPLTPQYAAPEQVRGEPVTTATDVYALGLLLYELLTGRLPYGGEGLSREELARAICETDPPPPSSAGAVVPIPRTLRGDLDAVVLKALHKQPSRRYASAEALAEDIRRCLSGQPVQARPDSLGYRTAKFVRRHKVGVGVATAAALSLLVGLLGTTWQATVAARERDRARQQAERAERVKEFLISTFRSSDPSVAKGREVTARELLERGMERIEDELSGQPAVQADLLQTMAVTFWSLGRHDQARSAAERSLEILRKVHGEAHPDIARGLDVLGGIQYASGDFAASEDLRRQGLDMIRRLLPADSPEVAESLRGLGTTLARRLKLTEAEALDREALAIQEKRLGPEHPETAKTMLTLADLLQSKGDYAAAAEMHRRVVALRRKIDGDRHPGVARALTGLGMALSSLGDMNGAEKAHREALAIGRQVLGAEHPSLTASLHYLASTLHTKGDLAEAEALYREVLALDRKLQSGNHSNIAVALGNLALVLADRGRFEEAMPMFEEAAALHAQATGGRSPYLAQTYLQHAVALAADGRARESLPLLDKSLSIYNERYGAEHPRTGVALSKLAEVKAELGEPQEAERLYRQVLDIQRRARPEPNLVTVVTLAGLGEVLTRQDRGSEAEPLLRDALAQAGQALSATHWRRGQVESVVGACLLRLGRREEAGQLLRTGHQRLKESLGEAHPQTAKARLRLAQM